MNRVLDERFEARCFVFETDRLRLPLPWLDDLDLRYSRPIERDLCWELDFELERENDFDRDRLRLEVDDELLDADVSETTCKIVSEELKNKHLAIRFDKSLLKSTRNLINQIQYQRLEQKTSFN
ncbi:hypothetical protein Bhyg_06137 [Pseudolycoriella hygida]|uniref:Uncharacterized protein n=1 Tax=Pseudolycoriella hygida TaxID=35572 RepID=A0A9Q0S0P4_9DIPT|nr:hypothetical protein Bhyg_06137 [Pseudolycoriella hygida]